VGGPELQLWRLAEQTGRRQTAAQTVEMSGQAADQGKCGVFFTVSP
jgi:hypothetical protein